MMFRLIIRASGNVSIGGFCRTGNNPFDLTTSNYHRIYILKCNYLSFFIIDMIFYYIFKLIAYFLPCILFFIAARQVLRNH